MKMLWKHINCSSESTHANKISSRLRAKSLWCLLLLLLSLWLSWNADAGEARADAPTAAAAATPIALTPEEQEWLQQKYTVRVRVGNSPPWEINTPEPQGMAVDYLTIIGQQFGIDFQFLPGYEAWSDGFNDMAGDHRLYDLLPAAKRTEERLKSLTMSDDYLHSPWVIFSRKESQDIGSIKDLRGRKVAVERGYVMHDLLNTTEPEIEFVVRDSTADAVLALSVGEADAYVGNLIVTSYHIQHNGISNLKVAGSTPFGDHDQAMATRKAWAPLISIINKGLKAIPAEQQLAIQQKWSVSLDAMPSQTIPLTPEEHAWLAEHPVIRVGYSSVFEPQFIKDLDGTYTGVFPDIYVVLGARLGVGFEIVDDTWSEILRRGKAGEFDMLSVMNRTVAEQMGFLTISPPYDFLITAFARRDRAFEAVRDEDLEGLRVAYYKDIVLFTQYFDSRRDRIHTVEADSPLDAFRLLLDGKADVAVGFNDDSYLLSKHMMQEIEPVYTFKHLQADTVTPVHPNAPLLASILTKAYKSLSREEINDILSKWTWIPQEDRTVTLSDTEQAWLLEHPVLRVGVPTNMPPLSFVGDDGSPTGMLIDLAKIIRERAGFNVTFIPMTFPDLLAAAQNREIDLLFGFETDERKAYLRFTDALFPLHYVIITRQDAPFIQGISWLRGKKVALVRDITMQRYLERDEPEIELVPVDTIADGLRSLSTGQIDACIEVDLMAVTIINRERFANLKIAAPAGYPDDVVRIGVRKDWPELVTILNTVMASIPQEIQDRLHNTWMTVRYEHITDWRAVWYWIAGMSSIFAVILGLTLYWNRRLAKEIAERAQAEDALRDNQRFIQGVMAAKPDIAHIYDLQERRDVFSSRSILTMLGYPPEEILALGDAPLHQFLHPNDAARLPEWFERWNAVRDGDVLTTEYRIQRKNGEWGWFQGRDMVFRRSPDGKVRQLVGTIHDITEHKQIETALRENEEKFRTIFNNAPVLIDGFDENGRCILWNKECEKVFGWTQEELNAHDNPFALFYPDPEVQEEVVRTISLTPDQIFREWRPLTKSGVERITLWANFRIPNGLVINIGYDITERKRSEEALQESESKYRRLVDQSSSIVLEWDPDGIVLFLNKYGLEFFGFPPEEILGHNVVGTIVAPVDSSGYDLQAKMTHVQRHPDDYYSSENENLRKNGENVWVAWTNRGIYAADGSLLKTLSIGLDRTPQKHMEEELIAAREAAEAANRAKSEFLANMSHELRTPLNAILGFSRLLEHSPNLAADERAFLQSIHGSGEHLLRLINDVLDMSKIEAGRTTLNESRVDLYELLDDLHDMMGMRAGEKSLQLRFDRAPDVPRVILSDEIKLRQVLFNLLSNAIKFTEKGSIQLSVNRHQLSAALNELNTENRLLFTVKDTGPGIAPDELDSLFEPFVQTVSGRRAGEGTGLGLSISRKFVQLMGGDMTVSSHIGQGTTFMFDLVAQPALPAGMRKAPVPRRAIALEPGQPEFRVLLADDHPDNRAILVKLLGPLGFHMREAVDGREVIDIWQAWKPHIILMDMRMPVVDGYAATRAIRAKEMQTSERRESGQSITHHTPRTIRKTPNTKPETPTIIIALTASAFEADRLAVVEAGCDEFIRKPFRDWELFDALSRHLGVRFVYEAGGPQGTFREAEEIASIENPKTKAEIAAQARNALTALPPDVLAALERAVIEGSSEKAFQIIDDIRPRDAWLAVELARLTDDFSFHIILEWLHSLA